MVKTKTNQLVTVRITGPDCWDGGRHYLPGEDATVTAELAAEWKSDGRAFDKSAEVTTDERQNSN
jgi:hypothetical protein